MGHACIGGRLGNQAKIIQVILNMTGAVAIEANRVESPLNRTGIMSAAKLF